MPILPLPQFEEDLRAWEEDRKAYERLNAPKSIVVRFGVMKLIGEYPYDGDAKPGCGSRLVVRTHRGVELGEMLTSTCPNSGCSKSVSRQDMLAYIENSGGRDYPFFDQGRVLRVATREDLDRQAAIEQRANELRVEARAEAERLNLPMKIVQVEPILGGERITVYGMSEERVDFREFVHRVSDRWRTRVDVRQVGARDEARLVADYERCGQYCCCKNFLKVLKPISMRSAKTQKATLEPLKISGRCGRLMCCLRYEDETYEDLKKRLPHRKSRVGTPEGDGIVIDAQILTQLVLVRLDADGRDIAVPVEELVPVGTPATREPSTPAPRPGRPARPERRAPGPAPAHVRDRERARDTAREPTPASEERTPEPAASVEGEQRKKKRRRKKRRPGAGGTPQSSGAPGAPGASGSSSPPPLPRGRRARARRMPTVPTPASVVAGAKRPGGGQAPTP
ncbi:MAG: regulatory iron-sulfur-containing complex subunit RicT [Phycisphaerales bacterium]|nr:regulatory iron-sulfur-containing complex subunit RicT [Phycisphaerales bacterium]